jgi:superoxide reductase
MNCKFYICEHCGKIITELKESEVPVMCCGQKMTELIPGTTDGAAEKHVPVYETKDNKVCVNIGAAEHPMTDAHYIEWICVATEQSVYFRYLNPSDKPHACFVLNEGEKVTSVFAYCNLHGLWKA